MTQDRPSAPASRPVHDGSLGVQKNMQTAIAEPALLARQLAQPAAYGVVARPARRIAHALAISLHQAARPRSLIS